MEVHFGSGSAWIERVDATGTMIGPRFFQNVQSFSLDFAFDTKELMGQYQMAQAIARGKQTTTGKITFADVDARKIGDSIFGVTTATGSLAVAKDEAGTVPAVSTYTVTVANSAHFALDLGVRYANTGILFTRVASAPTQGQYTVAAGVYTFAAADASAAVLISYEWNNSTAGFELTMVNQLQGYTPQFRLVYANNISPGPPGAGGEVLPLSLQLNACTADKFSLPYKMDDWMMMDIDFKAFADASNTLGFFSATN